MATLEDLQQPQFAQTIIPGLQEMVQPQNMPTGAQLAQDLLHSRHRQPIFYNKV